MTRDILDIYEDIALWFDANRSRNLMEQPYLDRAVSLAPKDPTVLDLGCGTGEPIAAYLISRGAHLTGIDTTAMISHCRTRFPAHRWLIGDMRELDLQQRFDIVIAWHSFFHLTGDEQRATFPRFVSHLREGGILVFTSGSDENVAWSEMDGHSIHHASLSSAEYRDLAQHHGLCVVDHTKDDAACGGATVWTMQKEAVKTP